MINSKDLVILKRNLPSDWVARIKKKVNFGATKIREVLKRPQPTEKDQKILDAAIEVAAEYRREMGAKASEQSQRIKELTNS